MLKYGNLQLLLGVERLRAVLRKLGARAKLRLMLPKLVQ